MLGLVIGFLVGVIFGVAKYMHHQKTEPKAPVTEIDLDCDPIQKHWALEIHGEELLAKAVEQGNANQASKVAEHLFELRLLGFAQGWRINDPGSPRDREEINRATSRWN